VARNHRRIVLFVLFVALLGLAAILALAFAHAWDASATRAECFETFWTAKWPKWIGCAIAAHESLAAGLIGLWAAIFAAGLAYLAIQMQIEGDRQNIQKQIEEDRKNIQMQIEEDRQKAVLRQTQAKASASIAITQTVYAAASTLFAVTQAQKAQDEQQIAHWDEGIKQGVSYIDQGLNHFTVSEAIRDLGGGDRLIYLGIVGQLSSFVAVNNHPSEHLDRATRLRNQHSALMKLRELLAAFDPDLIAVYDRDAGLAQQG
jgi:hypothetical protein